MDSIKALDKMYDQKQFMSKVDASKVASRKSDEQTVAKSANHENSTKKVEEAAVQKKVIETQHINAKNNSKLGSNIDLFV